MREKDQAGEREFRSPPRGEEETYARAHALTGALTRERRNKSAALRLACGAGGPPLIVLWGRGLGLCGGAVRCQLRSSHCLGETTQRCRLDFDLRRVPGGETIHRTSIYFVDPRVCVGPTTIRDACPRWTACHCSGDARFRCWWWQTAHGQRKLARLSAF